MRTPADVKQRAKVGSRLRLVFSDDHDKDLNRILAVIAVDTDGIVLEGGRVVKWGRVGNLLVQKNGFTFLRDGRIHMQYIFEKEVP